MVGIIIQNEKKMETMKTKKKNPPIEKKRMIAGGRGKASSFLAIKGLVL